MREVKVVKQIAGQISLFDERQKNEENSGLGEPCESCDVQWCSAICYIRRGYMWSHTRRFERDENGKLLQMTLENRECKETRFDR